MYILCKRSAPNEHGQIQQHSIHGYTHSVLAARAWYRGSNATDVVEINCEEDDMGTPTISAIRFPSWREAAEKARP